MALPPAGEAARIRALRPPKEVVDAWRPLGVVVERERRPAGVETVATVFLAGAECPFTCVFCDLWRHTLDGPTPRGALPAQLRQALEDEGLRAAAPARIKLYNASNFFDPRAVPPEDLPGLADMLHPFGGVTVESHPRMIGEACFAFAARISGRLEVALGLETIHPEALPRLGKEASRDDFARAAASLGQAGIDVRAFVLVGAPFVPAEERLDAAVRSAAWALAQGASIVALIPVRGDNGELARLAGVGEFTPPTLRDLEAALEGCADLPGGVVIADLWDAARLAGGCSGCRAPRIERLARMNLSGVLGPAVRCEACGAGTPRG